MIFQNSFTANKTGLITLHLLKYNKTYTEHKKNQYIRYQNS